MLAGCAVSVNVNDSQWVGEAERTDEAQIKSVLTTQKAAWNEGDIDGFMAWYWVSPKLRFASGGTVTRGWTETRDRYKARYTSKAIMGTLEFSEIEVSLLSEDAAVVHGRWLLARAEDAPSGLFTLVMKKFDGVWKVVSDTTTSAE